MNNLKQLKKLVKEVLLLYIWLKEYQQDKILLQKHFLNKFYINNKKEDNAY
jgi:hypothetical protein